jgi:hypothetical protein
LAYEQRTDEIADEAKAYLSELTPMSEESVNKILSVTKFKVFIIQFAILLMINTRETQVILNARNG